jgi:hypothetical protein
MRDNRPRNPALVLILAVVAAVMLVAACAVALLAICA